jgi:hypothetical protein
LHKKLTKLSVGIALTSIFVRHALKNVYNWTSIFCNIKDEQLRHNINHWNLKDELFNAFGWIDPTS